mmetsp:Transcript_41266/g.78869  ORF Transcript_41266/g.78869 Transcript_41266/m.78869 type:complete len:245 (+) Transcript_41266:680-1414(+)
MCQQHVARVPQHDAVQGESSGVDRGNELGAALTLRQFVLLRHLRKLHLVPGRGCLAYKVGARLIQEPKRGFAAHRLLELPGCGLHVETHHQVVAVHRLAVRLLREVAGVAHHGARLHLRRAHHRQLGLLEQRLHGRQLQGGHLRRRAAVVHARQAPPESIYLRGCEPPRPEGPPGRIRGLLLGQHARERRVAPRQQRLGLCLSCAAPAGMNYNITFGSVSISCTSVDNICSAAGAANLFGWIEI